jgi:type IV pilus assembly protein PilE
MKNSSGFSLIELMIVVAIIGIIGAIAMPSYDSYMKKGRRADAKVGLSKLADKQERYYLQNNTYAANTATLGLAATLASDDGHYTLAVDSASTSGFVLSATAVATGAQAGDDTTGAGDCTVMKLYSTGVKEGPVGSSPVSDACW